MEQNIILAGVGGQGILSLSYVICQAALGRGWHVKQSEVHGMAQRGGAVQSHLRLSPDPIASDLIAQGTCNLLISVEPLETLRYLEFLSPASVIVTSINPFKNITNYPDLAKVWAELNNAKSVIPIDAEALAKNAGSSLSQNTVVLGAASPFLEFPQGILESWVEKTWQPKGEKVVATNVKAFHNGQRMALFLKNLASEGASPAGIRFLSQHLGVDRCDPAHAKSWCGFLKTTPESAWSDRLASHVA